MCESHYHVRPTVPLIYSCLPSTDIRSRTSEYFLDEHIEKCSINIFWLLTQAVKLCQRGIDCFLYVNQ